jgi:hypothetical protein
VSCVKISLIGEWLCDLSSTHAIFVGVCPTTLVFKEGSDRVFCARPATPAEQHLQGAAQRDANRKAGQQTAWAWRPHTSAQCGAAPPTERGKAALKKVFAPSPRRPTEQERLEKLATSPAYLRHSLQLAAKE